MEYDEQHLGPKGALRAMYDARPAITVDTATELLERHGLGRAVAVESLGPYVTNFTHKILRADQAPVVFKGQYRATVGWSLSQEATALERLRTGTDLPVPTLLAFAERGGPEDFPYLLLSWLDGEPTLELYERGETTVRCQLARQLGEAVAAIHNCPLNGDVDLPVIDLRMWQRVVEDSLFADNTLRAALSQLAPDLEAAVRGALNSARDIEGLGPPVLTWRDAGLHNTVAQVGSGVPAIRGVFDFQSTVLTQPIPDFRMPYARLTGRSWRDGLVATAEWEAFVEGCGCTVDLGGPEHEASACTSPAIQVRHWWEILGHLHRRTPDWLNELLDGLRQLAA